MEGGESKTESEDVGPPQVRTVPFALPPLTPPHIPLVGIPSFWSDKQKHKESAASIVRGRRLSCLLDFHASF